MAALSSLCGGALCGFLLSASRAPAGLDLVGLPAAAALDAALFRAAALLAIALGLLCAPRRALGTWLAGATLGYALHGLVLFHLLFVDGWAALALLLAVTAAALALRYSARPGAPATPQWSTWSVRAGLVLGAAGVALALESLARPLRHFGRGLTSDDTSFGLPLLAATALGALAFGPLLVRAARHGLPLGLVAAAAAAWDGLGFLALIGDNQAFEGYLRSFGLAPQDWGGLACDGLLGARVFVLPGFCLGAALACVRERSELTSLLVGAALGTLAMPWLVDATTALEPEAIARAPAVRAGVGAALTAAGAALALLAPAAPGSRTDLGGGRLARTAGAAVALGLAAAVWLAPARRTLAYRPYEIMPMTASWVGEVAAGVLTFGIWPREGPRLALDGRALTPSAAGRADEALALGALPIPQRHGGRVLLVGQLTPARAQALVDAGARVIDRTGAWHGVMPAIEQLFFEDLARPPGAVLSPAAARRALAGEPYDLVVAPPVEGQAPATRAVRGHPAAIVWVRADTPLAGRPLGESVLLAARDFKHLLVGVGGAVATSSREAPDDMALFPAGPARPPLAPWAELRGPRAAGARHLVGTTSRLAAAGAGQERTAAALELLARAQRKSAVWDTDAEGTELDPQALGLLREAILARAGPPRPLERALAEYLAGVCVGKREVEWLLTYFEPLAASEEGWLALHRALLAADVESLDFESAIVRLGLFLAEAPADIALLRLRAAAHIQAGDPLQAARDLRAASALDPTSRALERELAIALIRALDPEGGDLAEELLRADPTDAVLALYLDAARGAAPMPPLPDPPRAPAFLFPG